MAKYGLIGHPIAHSKSPALFGAAYNGQKQYDLIEGEDFEQSWQKFIEEYQAINITAPFKEKAFAKADILTPEVVEIGATNLCIKTPEGIKAYNSDYLGVREIIKGLEGVRKVVVVGFGGAGKAAAAAARSLGLQTTVCNRTAKADGILPLECLDGAVCDADLLIYTLPIALEGTHTFNCRYVLEANYRDPVLRGSIGKSSTYIGGDQWLLMQAVTGYLYMTGEQPDEAALRKISEN